MGNASNYTARGNINPCVIVRQDTATDFGVLFCGANGLAIGIAQEGTKAAPIPSASTVAAANGDPIRVFGNGENCMVVLGGTVVAGDRLISDAAGAAVAVGAYASATPQNVVALAEEAGVAGEKIRCRVQIEIF